jgi:hypothetical protein
MMPMAAWCVLAVAGCGAVANSVAPAVPSTGEAIATQAQARPEQPGTSHTPEPTPAITYVESGGYVPLLIHAMDIYDDGRIVYHNAAPTLPITKQWPQARVQELKASMVREGFFQLNRSYPSSGYALPETTITLTTAQRSHAVGFSGHYSTPQNLFYIDLRLKQVIKEVTGDPNPF